MSKLELFGNRDSGHSYKVSLMLAWQKYLPAGAASDGQAMLRERFDADVVRLEAELADGQAYILGDKPTVADIALCAYMFWPEEAKVAYPAGVQAWLGRLSALPGWVHPYQING